MIKLTDTEHRFSNWFCKYKWIFFSVNNFIVFIFTSPSGHNHHFGSLNENIVDPCPPTINIYVCFN